MLATQPNTTEERVEEFVTARLERQVILDRDQPPLLWLVIDEAALQREAGGAKVMHDQLVHLVELSERPNITVEPEPKPAKNRIHLDLIPPGDDQSAEVARLTGLGATVLDDQPAGASWIVMADPEGNEFCLEG